MKVGNIVKRIPEIWACLQEQEATDVGIIVDIEAGAMLTLYIIHWPDGLSWEDCDDIRVVDGDR